MTYAPTDDQFVIPADPSVVVPEGGNAEPLPEGTKVLARILPTRKDGSSIEKRPYAKEGANSKITALAVRFELVPGQRGAGRNVFANVGMSRAFPSSGKPNFTFYGFFRALGYDVDGDFTYPGDIALMGSEIELVLGIEDDNDGGKRNYPKFFNKPNGIPKQAAPASASGVSRPAAAAPAWTPGSTPAATVPAAQAPVPGWLPPGAAAPAAVDPASAQAVQQAASSGPSF